MYSQKKRAYSSYSRSSYGSGARSSKFKSARDYDEDPLLAVLGRVESLLSEIVERLERIETAINRLGQQGTQHTEKRARHEKQQRRTGIDILVEQGVLFEKDLKNIRNTDAFFDYLRRNGAVVVETKSEGRIAISPEYLNSFLDGIREYTTAEEALYSLQGKEKRLFSALVEEGLLVREKTGWKLVTG